MGWVWIVSACLGAWALLRILGGERENCLRRVRAEIAAEEAKKKQKERLMVV